MKTYFFILFKLAGVSKVHELCQGLQYWGGSGSFFKLFYRPNFSADLAENWRVMFYAVYLRVCKKL